MKQKLFFLLIALLTSTSVRAQDDFSTPRNAMASFYGNINKEVPNVSVASKIVSSRHVFSKRKREKLAYDLKAYLDVQNIRIAFDSIPNEKDYRDSLTNENAFAVAPNIVLEKLGNNWYLSKETVESIPDLSTDEKVEQSSASSSGILADRQQARLERQKEIEQIANMPVDLSSPYATVKFFQENINSDPAVASRVISNKHIPHLNERIDIVEKLHRFLEGKGVYVDIDQVPEDPDYTDSLHAAGRYTYEISFRFSDIYLEREGKNWYLSKESAEKVPGLYKQAFPFGSDRLLRYLPTEGRVEFLGLYAWQYVAILVLIILTYLIFKFLNWLIRFVVTRLMFRFGYKELAKTYVSPVVRPIGLLIAFMMAEAALPLLQLPIKVNSFAAITVEILIPLFATIAFYYTADVFGLYLSKLAAKTENTFDDQIVPLIRKILKTFIVVIGLIYVLQKLGTDVKLLLGTLSVGGLALALAAQDTIKNFFGSLMIFLDKPFQAGHWVVTTDGIDGTVEEVGFRSTRIRTFENSLITVPNGRLSDASINNYGLRSYRRFKTHIAVTYDTPPDLLELFIEGLREIVEHHPHTRKDFYNIYMNDMGAHSLNILFYIFFVTPSWPEELQYRHEIILSIMRLAEKLGINFAFPTQTLHMENFPGKESLSPVYESRSELEPKMRKFFAEKNGKKEG